ncbi:MAG: nucleotidyltransferase family protein [Desulfobacterales bacterium]|nr:nucleotidyltransferase family protein [Desulfobacterales bacterium]
MSSKNSNIIKLKLPTFDPEPSAKVAGQVLKGAKVSGILIGRIAVWIWVSDPGRQEYTKDLDIAVFQKDLPEIISYLTENGYKVWELSIGGINVTDNNRQIKVDFIHRNSDEWGNLSPLFENAIEDASARDQWAVIGDQSFLLVSAEHLIAMKIATMEQKDDLDAKRILEVVENIDVTRLRNITDLYLGALGKAKLENILREVGHPDARKRGKYVS